MRTFYMFWFFFCSGWGYLCASFPSENSPPLLQVAATLPVALATSLALIWMELRWRRDIKPAAGPSLKLKPWNRPIGMALFLGLTFAFAGLWGVGLAWALDLSSPATALQMMFAGLGVVIGCYAAPRLFPRPFSPRG